MMDDLISRQAAIEAIAEIVSSMSVCLNVDECNGMKRMQGLAVRALEQLPSAQPEQRWIPCSEMLPKNVKKHYWVCTDTGYQCECRWTNVNHLWTELTTEWHWHFMDIPQYSDVIAWMPLPEPYEERRTDGQEREN